MRAKLKSAKSIAAVLAVAVLLSGCHYYHPYGYSGSYGHHGHGHGGHKHKHGRY